MSDALRHVRPGEPLVVRAPAWNAFVDAAMDLRRRRHDQQGRPLPTAETVLVRNDRSGAVPRGHGVYLGEPIIDPADNELEFWSRLAFRILPQSEHTSYGYRDRYRGRVAVLLEPLAAGQIGRAVIDGLAHAWVYVTDAAHGHATIGPDYGLYSTFGGPVQVLWHATGTEWQPAIVRLGTPAGAVCWGRAIDGWSYDADYVDVHPCADRLVGTPDESVTERVYLARPGYGHPNIRAGEVIGYRYGTDGKAACVTPYMDDRIGTVKVWTPANPSKQPIGIPAGWQICDGTNGTPDLRARFVFGTSGSDMGDTGGTSNHSHDDHPGHSHDVSDPWHYHDLFGVLVQAGESTMAAGMPATGASTTGISIGTSDAQGHTSASNLPPYCILAWIMRVN